MRTPREGGVVLQESEPGHGSTSCFRGRVQSGLARGLRARGLQICLHVALGGAHHGGCSLLGCVVAAEFGTGFLGPPCASLVAGDDVLSDLRLVKWLADGGGLHTIAFAAWLGQVLGILVANGSHFVTKVWVEIVRSC